MPYREDRNLKFCTTIENELRKTTTKSLLSEEYHTWLWVGMSKSKMGLIFLGVVFIVIGAVLFFVPTHAYTTIEVTTKHAGFYRPSNDENTWFDFSWYLAIPSSSFYIAQGYGPPQVTISPSQIFPLTKGATYRTWGLEIIVSEVHSDYFVLLVRHIS